MKTKRCIVLTATSSSQGTKGERKMKKKIILLLTAVIIVLSTAIVCVACKDAKTIKFDKKMGIGEIMSALVKTDIKNFTLVTIDKEVANEEYVQKTYFTQNGVGSVYEKNGEKISAHAQFFEGNRFYDLTKKSDQSTAGYACSIGDNEVKKESFDITKNRLSDLIRSLYSIKECGGKFDLSNRYEGAKVYVEDKNGFVIETQRGKQIFKDFNKTKLNVDEFEGYKNYDATPIDNYKESEDGTYYESLGILEYFGPYIQITMRMKSYTIQPQFTKDGKTLPVKVANLSDYRIDKFIIPTSIEKVYFDYNAEYKEFCYLGTKAEWESKVTVEGKPYKDIIVKCSDGDVTVKKQATENP